MSAISVIIPAFNAGRFIEETLQSLQSQRLRDWDAIVVDDGSTDDTALRVQRIAQHDPRIMLLQQSNQGEASARAAGLAHAKAEFIYFLDADDIALPNTLQRLADALKRHPDAIAVYGDHLRINAAGTPIFPKGMLLDRLPRPRGDILPHLLQRPLFSVGAAAIRRSSLTPQDILIDARYGEDWVMWVRLALKGRFIYLGGKPLLKYRVHGTSQTHRKATFEDHLMAIDAVFSLPQLQRLPSATIAKARAQREAFSYFALGCKALRNGEREASLLFHQSLKAGYKHRPAAWLMYALSRVGWLPLALQSHLGRG